MIKVKCCECYIILETTYINIVRILQKRQADEFLWGSGLPKLFIFIPNSGQCQKSFQKNPKSPAFHCYRKLNSSLVIIRNRQTNINLSKGCSNARDTKRVLSADDNIALNIGLVENANSAAVINQSLSLRLNTLTLYTNCCSNELDPYVVHESNTIESNEIND